MATDSKLDIIQGVNLMPWEWRNLGALFGSSKDNAQCMAARCNFVVRKGFDEADQTQYGNVLEGLGDVGFNLRAKQYAFHISASNLSYKQGEIHIRVGGTEVGAAAVWVVMLASWSASFCAGAASQWRSSSSLHCVLRTKWLLLPSGDDAFRRSLCRCTLAAGCAAQCASDPAAAIHRSSSESLSLCHSATAACCCTAAAAANTNTQTPHKHAGTDAPLRAQSMVGNALAGLKLAYAQEVADDRCVHRQTDLLLYIMLLQGSLCGSCAASVVGVLTAVVSVLTAGGRMTQMSS